VIMQVKDVDDDVWIQEVVCFEMLLVMMCVGCRLLLISGFDLFDGLRVNLWLCLWMYILPVSSILAK